MNNSVNIDNNSNGNKPKKYIKNESPNCIQIVEEKNVRKHTKHPDVCLEANLKIQEDIKRLILADRDEVKDTKDDSSDRDESTDGNEFSVANKAPKFGTVIQNRIFVGGFSVKTTDEDLWSFFSAFAHVAATRIIYDRAGVSKCYGFVTFANHRHARIIVKQSGGIMYSPMGRLRIAQAVRKQITQLQMISTEYGPIIPAGNFIAAGQIPQSGDGYYVPTTPPKSMCSYHIICGGSATPGQCTTTAPNATADSQTGRIQYVDGTSSVYGCPGNPVTLLPTVGVPGVSYEAPVPAYDATGLYTTCPSHLSYGHIIMPTPPVHSQYTPVGYPYQEPYPYEGLVAWYPGMYGGVPGQVGKSHHGSVPSVNHVQPIPVMPTFIY